MTTRSELGWRSRLPQGVRPYFEPAPLAALFLGISSGFAFSMIGATLTTRLAQHGITKSAVTAFALTFLAYNFKFLWAPIVDNYRLPLIGRFGQRRSWLWLVGVLVMASVAFRGVADPGEALFTVAIAAIVLGIAGATFDIIIDAYRIELLEPRQLGVGSGMSQYGWRIGSAAAGALALVLAARFGWTAAYFACAAFALPGMLVGLLMGEPARHREPARPHGVVEAIVAYFAPLTEFLKREGALIVLLFVLIHKIGDTLANLTLRLLFADLGARQHRRALPHRHDRGRADRRDRLRQLLRADHHHRAAGRDPLLVHDPLRARRPIDRLGRQRRRLALLPLPLSDLCRLLARRSAGFLRQMGDRALAPCRPCSLADVAARPAAVSRWGP